MRNSAPSRREREPEVNAETPLEMSDDAYGLARTVRQSSAKIVREKDSSFNNREIPSAFMSPRADYDADVQMQMKAKEDLSRSSSQGAKASLRNGSFAKDSASPEAKPIDNSNKKIYLNFNRAVSDDGGEALSQASISILEPKRKATKSQVREVSNPYKHRMNAKILRDNAQKMVNEKSSKPLFPAS